MPTENELRFARLQREQQQANVAAPSPAPSGGSPLEYDPLTMTRDILGGFGVDMLRGGVQAAGNLATYVGTGIGEMAASGGQIDPELSGLDENLDRFNQAFNEMVPDAPIRTEGGRQILNTIYMGISNLRNMIYGSDESPEAMFREKVSEHTDNPYLQRGAMAIPAAIETAAGVGAARMMPAVGAAASGVSRKGRSAYNKVSGKKPIPDVPTTDMEAGNVMREGTPEQIARAMEIDPALLDEVAASGADTSDLPMSSFATNEPMQRVMSAVERYGPESGVQKKNQLIDKNLRQTGIDLINAYDLAPEPYLLGKKWELRVTKYAHDIGESAQIKYDAVEKGIRPGDLADTPALTEFTNGLINKYGEMKFIPKEYKPLRTRLEESVKGSKELVDLEGIFGKNPTNPQGKKEIAAARERARGLTIDTLIDMKDEVQLAQRKREGPYKDLSDRRLSELEDVIDSDFQLYLDKNSVALNDGLSLAKMNQLADAQWAQKKKIEEIYTKKMGGNYTAGLVNIVSKSIAELAKTGNPKPYQLLKSQIKTPDIDYALPVDQRPKYKTVLNLDKLQKDTAVSGFAGAVESEGIWELIRKLNARPASARKVYEDLNPKMVSTLNTIEGLATKIEKRSLGTAEKGLPKLTRSEVVKRMDYPEMAFDRVANGLSRLYYYPAMIVGRSAQIVRHFREEPIQRAADMMDNPKFQDIVMRWANGEYVNGKPSAKMEAAAESLQKSKVYKNWFGTLTPEQQANITTTGFLTLLVDRNGEQE